MNPEFYLLPIFFCIALFYAAAGFGGGSSYLAVLSLFSFEFTIIRILALLCNITVVTGSVALFLKEKFYDFRKILPLVLLSVPFAFVGGLLRIDEQLFFFLLGITLLLAALLMIVSKQKTVREYPQFVNNLIGSGIGFLSGLVGIGGGIFLSPLLYLSKWGKPKQIAACTTLFIFVNSIAGLAGQIITNGFQIEWKFALLLMLSVFLGGQIGARLTVYRLSPVVLRRVTALLILIVGLRLLYKSVSTLVG